MWFFLYVVYIHPFWLKALWLKQKPFAYIYIYICIYPRLAQTKYAISLYIYIYTSCMESYLWEPVGESAGCMFNSPKLVVQLAVLVVAPRLVVCSKLVIQLAVHIADHFCNTLLYPKIRFAIHDDERASGWDSQFSLNGLGSKISKKLSSSPITSWLPKGVSWSSGSRSMTSVQGHHTTQR